jgi:cytochrome d ubiquinol oxidase subunit I
MSNVDLARWQFALTTLFHFLFVPVTIGLSWLVAIMQTAWRRTGNPEWYRLTRFFGKLLLINVAIGVGTGIVQEFEFGMNWSTYSRFVGDIFGAPLAIEGLAAFFLESTFLGIWIFGWNRISPKLHLVTIYLAAVGATLSAVFILAANSWMQHPVGYKIDKPTGNAQLTNIGAVFTNKVFLWAFPHTVLASFVIASTLVLSVSAWHLRRSRNVDAYRRAAAMALIVLFPASGLALFTGARTAVTITQVQPMKTAAMEALWNTEGPASFSLFQLGGMEEGHQTPYVDIEIPHLLSILATGSWDGTVKGMTPLQAQEQQQYGPGNYRPTVQFTYWSLRVMAYFGTVLFLFSGYGLWLMRRRRYGRIFLKLAVWSIVLPYLVLLSGWVLAETGRQPWIVWGLQKTADAASASVSTTQVAITLGGFALLYLVLGVVYFLLLRRWARRDLDPAPPFVDLRERRRDDEDRHDGGSDDETPLDVPALSY